MKNFVSNSAVKIICVILIPIISYMAIFSIIATMININQDIYNDDETSEQPNYITKEDYQMHSFLESDQCMELLTDDAYNICSLFSAYQMVDFSYLASYSADRSNLQVLVYSAKDNMNTSLYFNNRIQIEEGLSTVVEMTASYDPETTIVTKLVLDSQLTKDDKYKAAFESYAYMKDYHNVFVAASIIFSLLFIVLLIFLCVGVGHKKNSDTIFLNFYNRIPIEIILAIYIAALFFTSGGIAEIYMMPYRYDGLKPLLPQTALLSVTPFLIVNIILVPFIVSMAARIKASTNKVLPFWKNFLIPRLIHFICVQAKKAAIFIVKNSSAVFVGILSFLIYIIVNIFLIASLQNLKGVAVFLIIAFNIGVLVFICLFLSNLDRLRKETQALEKGEYALTDSNSYMLFFRKFAESLNHTKEGMSVALEKSIKSERFKTELITNVSHDLKTPLTSIINYVDLMKSEDPNSPKSKEYLDILDKQSKRLKHLIEDLIEVSKASTGNVKVELSEIDIEEFLSQVNGEFFDRFENSHLTAITEHNVRNLKITADGTLLWRVFNNLYSNICKYSLPGTRVYISTRLNGANAEITVKNISAQPLNITAEELTERFVRGDSSRNTEGSGLGLSIAKSLTETQNGTFEIKIDGDLFKVVLNFPIFAVKTEPVLTEDDELLGEEVTISRPKNNEENMDFIEINNDDIWTKNGF